MNAISKVRYVSINTVLAVLVIISFTVALAGAAAVYKINSYRTIVAEQRADLVSVNAELVIAQGVIEMQRIREAELVAALDSALVPEGSVGEVFHNRIVEPVKKVTHNVKESTQKLASKAWDKVSSYF